MKVWIKADSDETSSGENNIAYTRKLSLDTDIFSGLGSGTRKQG